MKSSQRNQNHIIFVEKGENVMETLTEYCVTHGIRNGKVSGIGAVEKINMGAFDITSKQYVQSTILDVRELVSFQGNVTLKDGQPFIHAHAIVGTHDLDIKGGHMFECTVAVVGEFIITEIDTNISRKIDETIGLATMCPQ